jgi:hypothetical protein
VTPPASPVLLAAPTPHRPSRFASFPSLSGTSSSHCRVTGDDEVSQVPGEPTRACAALSDPGRTFAPSHEDDRGDRGVAVADHFRVQRLSRCRCLIPILVAVSPPRGASAWPPRQERPRAPYVEINFGAQSRGLSTRCLRFAARIAAGPRKTRFRLVANLCRADLRAPTGFLVKFRTRSSSSPRLCLAQFLFNSARPARGNTVRDEPQKEAA